MEKIVRSDATSLLSQQVTGARYFFHNLAPATSGRIVLAMGGREQCNPDYHIARSSFPYHVVEYVVAGAGTLWLEGTAHDLRAGVVFAYGPKTRYEIRTAPADPMVKYFVAVAGRAVRPRLAQSGLSVGTVRHLAAHAEVTSVFEDLVREGQRSGALAARISGALLELLWLKIEDTASLGMHAREPSRDGFLRCKALIDAHAERLGTLAEIARNAGVEASSVCRWFRRYQGTSPYQYLMRRKMNIAAEYLIERGGLVKDVAQQVGFADPYHFSRAFKTVHGVSPSELLRYRPAGGSALESP